MTHLNTIEEALSDLKKGKCIILIDDETRENEGDLCCLASKVTPDSINFMATHARGLICLTLNRSQVQNLNLPLMAKDNQSTYHTNFTLSIEAKQGTTTGISAADRARTIQVASSLNATPNDIIIPGHIFPLQAHIDGVFGRQGQTEGSVDLAHLCGDAQGGVICEIMNEDGTMARRNDLFAFAKKHDLKAITIDQIIKYRLLHENFVEKKAVSTLPTDKYGEFLIHAFQNKLSNEEYIVLTKGNWEAGDPVLTRIHSQCLTGDVFTSSRCDCGEQLNHALATIQKEGKGAIIYLFQEGRGIGIVNKIRAYTLQDEGADTVQANTRLGFDEDLRNYDFVPEILRHLQITNVRLLTNNPKKIEALRNYNVTISERVPTTLHITDSNLKYLQTKKNRMGHLLNLS